jgi:nucleoside-triphosphatase
MTDQIYLITGPIHSGKTTRLAEWIKEKADVDGILQPVIDGKRYIRHISTGELRLLEISGDISHADIITIGTYKFDNKVFAWGGSELLSAFSRNPEWLIIDEFGKLEIEGKGIEPYISRIIHGLKEKSKTNLLIVVRDYLLTSLLSKYNLSLNSVQFIDQ